MDDYEPKHLGYLFERVQRHTRVAMTDAAMDLGVVDRYEPLTAPYYRLLSILPDVPTRVTDLARLSGMTKQALGQFMQKLESLGYVESSPSDHDRRVRMISRTAKGDEVVATGNDLWRRTERKWRRQIGPERYDVFLEVLVELATGWDPNETSVDP
jgi:DNA-binding MarR family transcriptional regulator